MLALFILALFIFVLPFAFPTPPPIITRFQATSLFSPNGDGRRDVARVNIRVHEPSTVRLEIRRGGATVAALVDGERLPKGWHSVEWDGRDAAGNPLPDGTYAIKLLATAPGGKRFDTTRSITVDTEGPLPTAFRVVSATLAAPGPGECRIAYTAGDAGSVLFEAHRPGAAEPLARRGPRPSRTGAPCAGPGPGAATAAPPPPPACTDPRHAARRAGNQTIRQRTGWLGRMAGTVAPRGPRAGTDLRVRLRATVGSAIPGDAPVTLSSGAAPACRASPRTPPLGARVGARYRGPAGDAAITTPRGIPRRRCGWSPARRVPMRWPSSPMADLHRERVARRGALVAAAGSCAGCCAARHPASEAVRAAGLVALVLGGAMVLASLVPGDDARNALESLGSPARAVAAVVAVLLAIAVLVVAVRVVVARPTAWFVLLAIAMPIRLPITVGSLEANLLVPLYAVIALGVVAWIWARLRGRVPAANPGPTVLNVPLAAFTAFLLVSVLWTTDGDEAGIKTACFYVPFVIVYALVLAWWPHARALAALTLVTLAGGVVAALMALWQFQTGELWWNETLQQANVYSQFFRVNGFFFDPNILGRYLAIGIIGALAVAWTRRRGWELAVLAGAAAIMAAGLFVTYSRSSTLMLMIGMRCSRVARWVPGGHSRRPRCCLW